MGDFSNLHISIRRIFYSYLHSVCSLLIFRVIGNASCLCTYLFTMPLWMPNHFVQYMLDSIILFSTGLIGLWWNIDNIVLHNLWLIDKCAIYLLKEGLQKLFSVYIAEVAEVCPHEWSEDCGNVLFALFCTLLQFTSLYLAHSLSCLLCNFLPTFLNPLVFPAFCYPFATFHFKVPILCLLLSFSLFSVVPSQTMKESLCCAGGGGLACDWQPCVGLVAWPLSPCQGKWREPREEEQWREQCERGGSEGPFMCRGFGNFRFQTEGSAVGGVSLAKLQNKISSYCFMVHVPLNWRHFV